MQKQSFLVLLGILVLIAGALVLWTNSRDSNLPQQLSVPSPAEHTATPPTVASQPTETPKAVAAVASSVPSQPTPPPIENTPPPPRPTPPVADDGLPTEEGVPKDDGTPLPKPSVPKLPKAPDGWLPPPVLGAATAPVTLVISSDFQCPVCRRVVKPIEGLAREMGDKVRIEFRHHALESHPRAEPAAVASMAAHKQGKFWEFHNLLFQNPGKLSDADFEQYAQSLGLDMEQFRKDLTNEAIIAQVRTEGKAADMLDARGTPAFFVNGKPQVGWGSYFGIKGMVQREFDAAQKLTATGTKLEDVYTKRVEENSPKPDIFVKYFVEGAPM
ncbi:MAG: thioredoxin domain-containing protein [Myxococcales bacterium]|nr:thioredoxin domain-containing protein [Myxococcales bacterium]